MAVSSVAEKPVRADELPVAEYRAIAPLAFVALGLGLSAALVIVSPLLAPLPVGGAIAAVVALVSIRRSRGELTGAWIAMAGLCLSLFFLGFGLTRHLGRQGTLEERAREIAGVFLDLVMEGRVQEAHQFRQSPGMRITSPEAIAEHYEKNKEAAQELASFKNSEGVKDLVASGKKADVRFENLHSATRDGQSDMLVLKYSYLTETSGERKPLWVYINRRWDEGSKRHQWDVGGIQNTPPYGSTE
jgi:hypothetical protein